jgi:hypothetical protein
MSDNRCSHFSLEVEELPVTNTPIVLRVPIRRCALAERMIAVISRTGDGRAVARKLTIATSTRTTEESRIEEALESADVEVGVIRVAFGPDLEAIHPAECTVQRCRESCTPSYRMLLNQFGFAGEAERETGKGCLDHSQVTEDALSASSGDL